MEQTRKLPQQMGIAQRARRERQTQNNPTPETVQQQEPLPGNDTTPSPEHEPSLATLYAEDLDASRAQIAARTANNVMRHEYRVLTDIEKAQMKKIKDIGVEFVHLLEDIGGVAATPGAQPRMASRELSLAQTKIEEAVMWAVKHITR